MRLAEEGKDGQESWESEEGKRTDLHNIFVLELQYKTEQD